jgi:Tol biopolymer transport system component
MNTQSPKFWAFLTVGLITAIFWAPLPLRAATNVKLSGVLTAEGNVSSFQISRDGRYAVYLADQDTDDVPELYSVLLGGGPPVRLNPILLFGRAVTSFQISPDSRRVVYLADQDDDNVVELYSVPIGGPAAAGTKLNKALVANGDVAGFQISPDSNWVVYGADQEIDGATEIYSAPIAGPPSAGLKLNKALVPGGSVENGLISPDSSRVVYQADQEVNGVFELFSVPIGGPPSAGLKLNKALVPGGNVEKGFLISPDSSRVVYQADQEVNGVFELFSAPIGGPPSAGLKLNKALVPGGNVREGFLISPDSSRVVYGADQETVGASEVYSVPIGGPPSAGLKLNKALVLGGSVEGGLISPDGSRVIYRADQEADGLFELFSVPIGGPAADGIKLNKALIPGGDVVNLLLISPDSSRALYVADQEIDNVFELFSVPIKGPASDGIKLNKVILPGGGLTPAIRLSPDSRRVVYAAALDTAGVFELYSTPIGGPAAAGVKLNGALVTGGNVLSSFQISPDSGRVIYIADQDTDNVFELYMTSDYFLHLPLLLSQG